MAMDMRSYEIGWDQGGKPVIARKPEEYADAYYCREYRMQGVHAAMAVCTTDPDIGGTSGNRIVSKREVNV